MEKIYQKFFIFIFIFFWIFSGWPQIWKNPSIPPKIQVAQAVDCPSGWAEFDNTKCRQFLTITGSNQTWVAPADWDNNNNTVECIGAGGSGGASTGSNTNAATGGGGGAYSIISDFEVANPGETEITYQIGAGGGSVLVSPDNATSGNPGGDTWLNATSFPSSGGTDNSLCAAQGGEGGLAGAVTINGGAGGLDTSGWGETRRSGGSGGTASHNSNATGGGGAAGNSASGGNGSNSSGTNAATNGGQANGTGASGGSGGTTGGGGTAGTEYSTEGSGGGGGGGRNNVNNGIVSGGSGGLRGGGGGGALNIRTGGANYQAESGAGTNGVIVITYTPVVAQISVSVSDGMVSYGIMLRGTSKSTLSGDLNDMQTATNDSSVTVNFNIRGMDATGGGCTWTLASNNGSNQYVHQFCNDTDLDCSSPPTNYTALTTIYQTLATGVTVSSTVDFQLRLTTPDPSGCYGEQTVDVTIQAVQP